MRRSRSAHWQPSSANPHALSLTFLGTGTRLSRSPSATALNFARHSWLIDCGEGTPYRMLCASTPKPESISRIFITRMLVDRVSGLVPLMSILMSKQTYRGPPGSANSQIRLRLYGPAGLRAFVRANLQGKLCGMYQANELLTEEDLPSSCAPEDLHENELPGDDFVARTDGRWPRFLVAADDATVSAALLDDTAQSRSLGYAFEESERGVTWHDWLAYLESVPRGMFAADMRIVRDAVAGLTEGDPEGFLLDDTQFFMRRRGRKVVILVDAPGGSRKACDIASVAQSADVLVHPSMMLPFSDGYRMSRKREVNCGHSAPCSAGAFSRGLNAKLLVLDPLGPSYPGTDERETRVKEAVQQAASSFGGVVIAARDLLVLPVPLGIGPDVPSGMVPRDMNTQLRELNSFALRLARMVIRIVQAQAGRPATPLLSEDDDSPVDSGSNRSSPGSSPFASSATTPARDSPKPSLCATSSQDAESMGELI